jgi:hypothetical protein
MNEIATTESATSIAGLPVPTKEKVARWMAHGGVIALAVVGVITFMPYINKALTLLLNGMFTLTEIGLVAAGTLFGAFFLMTIWPLYKKGLEILAHKTTWAMFEYDPIAHIDLWLAEYRHDVQVLEGTRGATLGTIAENERTINEDREKATKGDALFAQAVRKFGADSIQAKTAAIEPGMLRETADTLEKNLQPLYVVRDTLTDVIEASDFGLKQAEAQMVSLSQQLKAAKGIEGANAAAYRALKGRSQRRQEAMQCTQIIRDRFASSFGRLQNIRELSRDVVLSVDLAKGTYHQQALERLQAESKLISGGRKPETLEAKQVGQEAGVSFYKVPESARIARK